MYKGIFWVHMVYYDDDMYYHNLRPVRVKCDIDGNPLENVEFSSKSGTNFNHETEWEKLKATERLCRRHSFDYFPRGRVEIDKGNVKVFANPVIIEDEKAKNLIKEVFELNDVSDSIKWIADNSEHYQYVLDVMDGGALWLDDDDDEDS